MKASTINTENQLAELASRHATLTHVTFNNYTGSVEHYYHFLLGALVPFSLYYRSEPPNDGPTLIRSCGPLDRIFDELRAPNLYILNKQLHIDIANKKEKYINIQFKDLPAFDSPRAYDVQSLVKASAILKHWLTNNNNKKDTGRGKNQNSMINVIERGTPPNFYMLPDADIKTSSNQRRCIANHDALVDTLCKKYNYCTNNNLEGVPLRDQIELFSDSKIVVGQHGAALANILWMPEGGRVVEIIPGNIAKIYHLHFANLAEILGLGWSGVIQHDPFGPVDINKILCAIGNI